MYVRPILEYAAVVWAPHTRCDIERLEVVLRWAARFVMSDYYHTSSVTVSSRRQTSRLYAYCIYKILHNIASYSCMTLPCQATSHHHLDSQEVMIKNLSYPNLELMHI